MTPLATRALKLAMLNRLATAGGPLNAGVLQLVAAPFTPGPGLVPGDLTPATFTGYAEQAALVMGGAYVAADGTYRMGPPSVQFEATDGVTPNVIYGWAVLNTAKTGVEYAGLLDNPVSIQAAGDGIVIDPELILPG